MDRYQSVTFAREYLQNIISFFGENIAVSGDDDGEVITLRVESSDINSILIGRGAETLRALQYIVSSALRAQHAAIVRVSVDIADYKKQHEEKVADKARGWIERVRATGEPYTAHLNPADRRIVHQVAADAAGITTVSEGEGRERHVIIQLEEAE